MQKHVGEELHLTKVRDSDSECQVAKAQEQMSGATPPPRSGGCTGSKGPERSYSKFEVRRGSREEIPLVQGKEQWLCFAGAAVKRYAISKARETQVRWEVL